MDNNVLPEAVIKINLGVNYSLSDLHDEADDKDMALWTVPARNIPVPCKWYCSCRVSVLTCIR